MSFRTMLATSVIVTLALLAGCTATSSSGSSSSGTPAGTPIGAGHGQVPAHIPGSPASVAVSLAETGSTMLYPLFGAWASAYHRQFPSVSFTTAATGSGTGIADASSGKADIGASDAFLSSGNLVANPGLLNIPLAISAQQVNYNLPHVPLSEHVKLNGQILAQMYDGTITNWDAPAIRNLNPGVRLPNLKVVPLHRMESSGDTFLFTSFLATSAPAWNTVIGYGTTVAWPQVPSALAEHGNSGMVVGCKVTPGCVAYVGISYLSDALAAHLGEAELANAGGHFELPTPATMSAAAASLVSVLPANETISMINGPAADGYPIVNYEYAIVSSKQPSAAKARDLQAFLHWATTAGNAASFLDQVRFQPLPAAVVALADSQIASIH